MKSKKKKKQKKNKKKTVDFYPQALAPDCQITQEMSE